MAGRRPQLNDETQARILQFVRSGADYLVAARKAGIPASTANEWRLRGEGRHPTRPGGGRYERLVDAVEEARAEAELAAQLRIQRAAMGGTEVSETRVEREYELRAMPDGTVMRVQTGERVYTVTRQALPVWQADAWWLERARGERWRKKQELEITGEVGSYVIEAPPKAADIAAWQEKWGGGAGLGLNGNGNGAAMNGHGGNGHGH